MAARPVPVRRLTAVAAAALLTAVAAGGLALPAAAHDHSHQHGAATSAPAPTAGTDGHVHEHQHAPATPSEHAEHPGHTEDPPPADRPRAAVLGGFAAVNAAVLAGAFVARRRGLAGHQPRVRRG